MSSRSVRYLSILFALTFAGCAQVHVKRTSGAADEEGMPYYLPRPYVQVYEPFVVGAEVTVVSGTLSTDGQYLLIDNVKDTGKLNGLLNMDLTKDQPVKVPVKNVRKAGATQLSGAGPQGGETTSGETQQSTGKMPGQAEGAKPDATGETKPDQGTGASQGGGEEKDNQPIGNAQLSVVNTTAIYTPTLGRRYFDVVWMPDFDEKYIVSVTQGLGNSNVAVTLTQGWGLYGLDARVDNSAIVKPLLNFYSTGLDALSKLAKSKILPASLLEGGAPQGALETAGMAKGARVSIKVTKVQVVAPGLYPVLKPSEITKLRTPDANVDATKMRLPSPPYTNIAFNTYDVVVIEAARPTGDTPMNLQRYFDSDTTPTPQNSSVLDVPNAGSSSGSFDASAFEKQVNALLANRKVSTGEYWQLSNTTVDGTKLKVNAKVTGGANKPSLTLEQLKAFIAQTSKGKFSAANVEVAEIKDGQ